MFRESKFVVTTDWVTIALVIDTLMHNANNQHDFDMDFACQHQLIHCPAITIATQTIHTHPLF